MSAVGRGVRNETLEQKWSQFERQADECDVLFLGTSRIYRHLDPAAFDAALYEQGIRVRSFNLGMPRMSILEAQELADRLVARRPQRLKLVVLEPMLFIFDLDNWSAEREMATHDLRGTHLAVSNTLGAERRHGTAWLDRLCYAMPHVLSFACREVNLGLADPLIFPPCPQRPGPPPDIDALAGYGPLPVRNDPNGPWRERFRRFLALPQPPDWNGTSLSAEELAYFKHLVGRIRQTGAEVAFLLGPRVKRDSHTVAVLESHPEHFADVPLLDYLRGHGPQTLYQLDYWYDFDHLNAVGARELSQRVARDVAPRLRRRIESIPLAVRREAGKSNASSAKRTSMSLRGNGEISKARRL
ncbi:MAG TPA: hypothetical protein VHC19_00025 [Pirellulales bacterium]|nr:hypothetical protein [Pirellulales bacterium]